MTYFFTHVGHFLLLFLILLAIGNWTFGLKLGLGPQNWDVRLRLGFGFDARIGP